MENDNLILICGKSATGKSLSLRNIPDPNGVMYLNCEAGKKLPFKSSFQEFIITRPEQVIDGFTHAETDKTIHTIVIDSLTFLMDMYESTYVVNSPNTMKAWQDYAQFFMNMMKVNVASSTKNVIFIAHVKDQLNETEMVKETFVPIKGSTKDKGVEAYFTSIVSTKKVNMKTLEGYESPLLNISDKEKALGFKYVFQTDVTKETINERTRAPWQMWDTAETYIDNDVNLVIERHHSYYN